ncbi:MAG: hypothetical protein IJZ21_05920, partial [Clostridia bacterium]|nr:hypothetical protein [Clostridia bacterium]
MKRFFALTLALIMVLCVCGCSSDNNTSSEPSEVEYETIIVDQNGQEITSSTDTAKSEGTTENSSMDPPTQSSMSSNASGNSAIVIDYDTVVEVDICDDIIRGYLEAKDAKNQYFCLSTYSCQKYDHQVLSLDWYRDGSLSYTIYFSENADFSNSTTITTKYSNVEGTTLIPGKTYYWKVIGTLTADAL